MQTEEVVVGDLIVDRATLRGLIREKIAAAARKGLHALGRWEKPALQWQTRTGRNIFTIATYRGPHGDVLFVFFGRRLWSRVIA